MKKETSDPKTTRPSPKSQREKPEKVTTAEKIRQKLDAFPDKIDIRDWFYQPTLRFLPDQVINCENVPLILNQGSEGACTGFALAAVINYHLVVNGRFPPDLIQQHCASPRMLYEMARRYDEWPGEEYEGSSARGTMKGWMAHGVVSRTIWDDDMFGPGYLNENLAAEALNIPAGAFFRVQHRQVRDMHAALNESGILYATIMVHKGWLDPKDKAKSYKYISNGKSKTIKLPVIQRQIPADGGHAIAIVGYTLDGFIIQNSWGSDWGINGFALLPYEDWMLHASDCWVVQIGVPVKINLWNLGYAKSTEGMQRASQLISLDQIRPFVINIGNDGRLSDSGDYWTTPEDVVRLFENIGTAAGSWKKKRVMLYFHSALNSEKQVARSIISFKKVCLENEIYPVHIMWETDFWTSLKKDLLDVFTNKDADQANWINKLREGTAEILDRTFELTAAKPGRMLWGELKENAQRASAPGSAMSLLAETALKQYSALEEAGRQQFELHIVAHSAGCIFTAYTLRTLLDIGVPVKSIQFMAPAITVDLFREKLLPFIKSGLCPLPTLYLLSDIGERDDQVGPYGKSLLYLVSNAFEPKRETPILGMQRFIQDESNDSIDKEAAALFAKKIDGWSSVVISGKAPATEEIAADICRSETHAGFDKDKYTLNSILYRILKHAPPRPFEVRDLQY